MTPEKTSQILDAVKFFHGKTVTQDMLTAYCTDNGIELIDIGMLDDHTFQYNVDNAMSEMLVDVATVLATAKSPSGFEDASTQNAAYRAAEKALLERIENRTDTVEVISTALTGLSRDIAQLVKNVNDDVIRKQTLVANTLVANTLGDVPRKVKLSDYTDFIKRTESAIDAEASVDISTTDGV